MMPRSILLLLSAVALSLFISCRPATSYPDELLEAERLSAEDPKRAVAMVDSLSECIDRNDLAQQAYYELVRIKAYDRAYIRHTSDSTILQVVHYYEQHPTADLLAWAYCYAGRVYRDLNDAPRALDYFHRSLEAIPEGEDAELRARVLSQIGYIYAGQSLYSEARAVKQQVLMLDSLAGNRERMAVGYKDLAQCSFALRELPQANRYLNRALRIVEQEQLEKRRADLLLMQARIANEQGQYQQALSLIAPYLSDSSILNPVPYYVAGSNAYQGLGRSAEAELLCQKILADGRNIKANYKAARMLAQAAELRHDQQQLSYYLELSALWFDSIAQSLDQSEEIQEISRIYNYQLRDKENRLLAKQVSLSRIWLLVALLSLLCLLLVLMVVWFRSKHKQTEIRLQQTRIQQLQRELSMRDKSIEELSDLLSLHRVSPDVFDTLFRTSPLYPIIKGHISNQTILSPSEWSELERFLNEHLPQFLPRLRSLYDFSEVEWRISLLVRLSFRNVEIATLLCKHPSAITYAKKRLCIKVLNAEAKAEVWDDFVLKL